MERFELNDIHIKFYKSKNNNLKKVKLKNDSKGWIYSENGQYAGSFVIKDNKIIYFEVIETFAKTGLTERLIKDAVLLGGKEINISSKDTNLLLEFQKNKFSVKESTKKEFIMQYGVKQLKKEDNP